MAPNEKRGLNASLAAAAERLKTLELQVKALEADLKEERAASDKQVVYYRANYAAARFVAEEQKDLRLKAEDGERKARFLYGKLDIKHQARKLREHQASEVIDSLIFVHGDMIEDPVFVRLSRVNRILKAF